MLWMMMAMLGAEPAAPVLWSFDRRAHSGASQKGLACLPSGRFALGDVAMPEDRALREVLGAGVTAEVLDMEASLCSAYMGMGKGPSSRISLQIRWHVGGEPCGDVVAAKFRQKNADLRFDRAVFLDALRASQAEWQRTRDLPARCRVSAD